MFPRLSKQSLWAKMLSRRYLPPSGPIGLLAISTICNYWLDSSKCARSTANSFSKKLVDKFKSAIEQLSKSASNKNFVIHAFKQLLLRSSFTKVLLNLMPLESINKSSKSKKQDLKLRPVM